MAVTAITDVFVPEVIGDIATNVLFYKTPILRSGVVANVTNAIFSVGGNTITFPYFDTATGLVQTNPGATRTGVTPSKVSMNSYEESLKSKIISLDFDKNAMSDVLQSAGLNEHVGEMVASESALDIQSSLILSAEETDLALSILGDTTKTLNVDAIAQAKMKRGEHADDGIPILFVHTKQATDLMLTSDFKTLASAATTAIVKAGASVPPGAIGMIHGAWVVVMDSIRNQAAIPAISGITRSSTTATVTTAAAHGLRVGDYVVISGATETQYNGTWVVASVPTDTTFTYTGVTGSPTTPATGTPAFTAVYNALMIWPGALGLAPKKAIGATVKDVHAGTTVVTVDFDFRYGTTLYRRKPRGVVRLFTR